MRERPLAMKRDDWESLNGRLSPGRLNATLITRRWRWKYKQHWPLYHKGPYAKSSRLAYRKIFGGHTKYASEMVAAI